MKYIASKPSIVLLSMITFAFCFLPLLSSEVTDDETCTFIIKGYNLSEWSVFGAIILISPFLVPVVLYGCQSKKAKELELVLILLGNIICYTHGVHHASNWLTQIGVSAFEIHPALILYPLFFGLLCFVAIVSNAHNKENSNLEYATNICNVVMSE